MSSPSTPDLAATPSIESGSAQAALGQLLARQKAPHLSELTLGLLHKFNNVFTGVMFLTEECASRDDATGPISERLEEIVRLLREAHRSIDRITQLHLDEEEKDAGYHELDAVIAAHLDLAQLLLPRGTALTHAPAEERLTFYASQRALTDILLHVVGNSGEILPKRGGAVTIVSSVDPEREDRVVIEIRDNGPGFTPEILERLFVSFCTTKDESRHPGLGLVRCRELARSFGGDLVAKNHPEGGALLILTLPRDNSQSSP